MSPMNTISNEELRLILDRCESRAVAVEEVIAKMKAKDKLTAEEVFGGSFACISEVSDSMRDLSRILRLILVDPNPSSDSILN